MISKKSQISEDSRLVTIGNRIRTLRKANTNLSAEDFANEKGFDSVQYSQIENGANITMKTLLKVVGAHNITLEEFFKESEKGIIIKSGWFCNSVSTFFIGRY